MAEYINRDATIKAIHDVYEYGFPTASGAFDDFATKIVPSLLNSIPAADVVPVVHGRWDDSGRYTFPSGDVAVRCTNCGCALTESEYHLNNWNYCPVCGAKMDGGTDND